MEQQTGSKLGKKYVKGIYCHPAYLIIIRAHHVKCWAGWSSSWNQDCQEKYQQPQISRCHHLNSRKQRGIQEPLDEGERRDWKSWLKIQHSENQDHGIQLHHFMANRWGNNENNDFFFSGFKITVDGNCNHEIKRRLFLGKKAMTNLDNVVKWRDITLLTKVHIVKALFFPVVTYGCESWTIKKAECWRIDAFELWCWKRLSRVP